MTENKKKVTIVPAIENFQISLSPTLSRNAAVTPRSVRTSLSRSDSLSGERGKRRLQKCQSVFGKNLLEKFGERRDRRSSLVENIHNIKEVVDKNLIEFLESTKKVSDSKTNELYHSTGELGFVESNNLQVIRDIAEQFLHAPVDSLINGTHFAQNMVQKLQELKNQGEQQEYVLIIRLLLIISPCSRFEVLHKKDKMEENDNEYEYDQRNIVLHNKILQDLASISKFVADAEKELKKEEESVHRRTSQTSSYSPEFFMSSSPQSAMGSSPSNKILTYVKEFKGRDRSKSSPPAFIESIMVTCRICERPVDERIFVDHLNMCSLKSKHEIRAIECDGYLKKLRKKLSCLYDKLSSQKKKIRSKMSDKIEFIHNLLEYCQEGIQSSVDSVEKLTSILTKLEKSYPEKKVLKIQGKSPLVRTASGLHNNNNNNSNNNNNTNNNNASNINDEKSVILELESINYMEFLHELVTLLQIKKKLWRSIFLSSSLIRNNALLLHNKASENSPSSSPTPKERSILTTSIPKISDFEILKPITKGGFARVYLAKKRATNDLYAIKVLKKKDMVEKNQVDRIFIEKNILSDVSCPYVVRLYYSMQTKDNLCLAMEFLNGGDLFSLLSIYKAFPNHYAQFYIAEALLSLQYLHNRGIIHRDLKPDNFLINSRGHLKLTDFGLSHAGLNKQTQNFWDLKKSSGSLTVRVQEKSIIGTPDYLAPEVLLGLSHSYPVDYWALGVILFEFLTGVPPFMGDDTEEIFSNIISGRDNMEWPEIPDEMSEDAHDLIYRLLDDNPSTRLGCKGAEEVKNHPYFKGINWDVLTQCIPPFVPKPCTADDTSYFKAREEFWPMIEEDFGTQFNDLSMATSRSSTDDKFEDFWSINVENLKQQSLEVFEEEKKHKLEKMFSVFNDSSNNNTNCEN